GRARLCHGAPARLFVAGGALTLGVMALAALAGSVVVVVAHALGPVGLVLEAAALKSTLALRGLARAARSVAAALAGGELAGARLDELANLVPAPLAALTIVMAAGRRCRAAWSTMLHDHAHTASPNADWTMSATAGALRVTLEKPTTYRLGHGPNPTPTDIDR